MLSTAGSWGARELGEEFRRRISGFDPRTTNALPLLQRSIAGGRFIQSHNYFCGHDGGNHFELAGRAIADKLLLYRDELQVWL